MIDMLLYGVIILSLAFGAVCFLLIYGIALDIYYHKSRSKDDWRLP